MKKISLLIFLFLSLFSTAQVGIGTTAPGNTLEINSGTAGNSGLRFTQMNSSSAKSTNSGNILAINDMGDVIVTPQIPKVVSATSTISAATPTNTTLTLGEIQFRCDKTVTGSSGNIEMRSSTASTLNVTVIRHEEYNGGSASFIASNNILNNNAGTYTTFAAGSLDINEILIYYISSAGGSFYKIYVINRNNIDLTIIGEQLK